MLHEVRIYGADGAFKRIIPVETVTRQYWRRLRERNRARIQRLTRPEYKERKPCP